MQRLATIVPHIVPLERKCTSVSAQSCNQSQEQVSSSDVDVLASFMYPSAQKALMDSGHKFKMEPSDTPCSDIQVFSIDKLSELFPNAHDLKEIDNLFWRTKLGSLPNVKTAQYRRFIRDNEVVLMDIVRRPDNQQGSFLRAFHRAGPRHKIIFRPGHIKAAIVTCGGLCPGLNDVVYEIFNTLYYNYGADTIYGIQSGFRGFHHEEFQPWSQLTPENIDHTCTNVGGTILGSSRGGFDAKKIVDALELYGINQLYIVGGDGTHRAALKLSEETLKRKLKMVVCGVPKTIDNDIGVIDRSFGFNTAVKHAVTAIESALIEAKCAPHGVGIVKLMGRHAGFIAAHASLAAQCVDLCLVPEVQFQLDPDNPEDPICVHVRDVLDRQGYCVVVVAEGAGAHLLKKETKVDESGNVKVVESIGRFLMDRLGQYLKEQTSMQPSFKYIDPSYMIRSTPAEAHDSIYCLTLAQNVVHAAMHGFTGFTVGTINNRSVLIPMPVITASSPCQLNPFGRTWERVLSSTHQPQFVCDHKPCK